MELTIEESIVIFQATNRVLCGPKDFDMQPGDLWLDFKRRFPDVDIVQRDIKDTHKVRYAIGVERGRIEAVYCHLSRADGHYISEEVTDASQISPAPITADEAVSSVLGRAYSRAGYLEG